MQESKTYVVSYDVADDNRPTKLARLLESKGRRVQYSVFEVVASVDEMKEIFRLAGQA